MRLDALNSVKGFLFVVILNLCFMERQKKNVKWNLFCLVGRHLGITWLFCAG